MDVLRKSDLLLSLIILPMQLLGMETDKTYAQFVEGVKVLPNDIKAEIFKHKCAQICPQLIEQAQTLPELKELFKTFITLDRDFRPSTLFQSTLFRLLEMKKYKILCEVQQVLFEMMQADIKNKKIPKYDHDMNPDIIDKGINGRDKYHNTPLHLAAQLGYENVVRMLIKNGADLDTRDRDCRTPLHVAALEISANITKILIENGADINAKDKYQVTPLHRAVCTGYKNLIRMLLEKGADVNTQDKDQFTPLHSAALWGKEYIAELLLENGANMDITNNENQTALDLARREGHEGIVELLKAAQSNSNK